MYVVSICLHFVDFPYFKRFSLSIHHTCFLHYFLTLLLRFLPLYLYLYLSHLCTSWPFIFTAFTFHVFKVFPPFLYHTCLLKHSDLASLSYQCIYYRFRLGICPPFLSLIFPFYSTLPTSFSVCFTLSIHLFLFHFINAPATYFFCLFLTS